MDEDALIVEAMNELEDITPEVNTLSEEDLASLEEDGLVDCEDIEEGDVEFEDEGILADVPTEMKPCAEDCGRKAPPGDTLCGVCRGAVTRKKIYTPQSFGG